MTPSEQKLIDEIAALRAQNEALKQGQASSLSLKVGEKGGLMVIGLGRWPVTLYKEQWTRLLNFAPTIQAFLKDNDSKLKAKGADLSAS